MEESSAVVRVSLLLMTCTSTGKITAVESLLCSVHKRYGIPRARHVLYH
jgi:hypothetical protein